MRKLITSVFAIAASCTASVALPQNVAVLYSNVGTTTRLFRNASDEFVWDDLQLAGGGLLTIAMVTFSLFLAEISALDMSRLSRSQ